jgi:catechol 2,3-dioxygenase-like lactoylglutathione lyase family enzyme
MDRINHVKIVTPEPEAVDAFLTEVLDVPEGWTIPGARPPGRHAPAPVAPVTWESVTQRRGDDGSGGRIAGSSESRQFQILRGERPHIWSVAVGTRHLERAHQRCKERGIPCSDMLLVDWNERDGVRAFFAEVGGILFEVMRVEPKAARAGG